MVILVGIELVFFFALPGYLATVLVLGRRRESGIPIADGLLITVLFSLLVTVGASFALAAVGAFSFTTLAVFVGSFCLLLALGAARSGAKPVAFNLTGGWIHNLGIVVLVAVSAVVYLPGSELIHSDSDQGMYVNTAVLITRHGGMWFGDPLLSALPPALQSDHAGSLCTGMYFDGDAPFGTAIAPHGFYFFPAFLAVLYLLGGLGLCLSGPCILMLLSLWAFYVLASRYATPLVALVATGVLAINPASLWFSRYPFAEGMAEALILSGFALFALAFPYDSRGRDRSWPRSLRQFWMLAAGMSLGSLHLAKIEFVLLPAVILLFTFWLWTRDRLNRVNLVFLASYLVFLGLSVVYAFTTHRLYFLGQLRNPEMYGRSNAVIVATFTAALAAGVLAFWLLRHRIRRLFQHPLAGQFVAVVGVVSVLAAAYLYFVLPARVSWYEIPPAERNAVQSFLAKSPEINPSGLQSYGEWTFRSLGFYITAPAVFVGLIFMFIYLRRKEAQALVPFIVFALAQTAFFLFISGKIDATAGHFHSPGRRFLNLTLPAFLFFAIIPWFAFARARTGLRSRIAFGIGIVLVAYLTVHSLWAIKPFVTYHPLQNMRENIRRLAKGAPPDRVWITSQQSFYGRRLLGPLRFFEGGETFWFSPQATPERMARVLDFLESRGLHPVIIRGDDWQSGSEERARLEMRLSRYPRKTVPITEWRVTQRKLRIPDHRDCRPMTYTITVYGVAP
jgi:hypothetical protein